jgi:hypothetical protein
LHATTCTISPSSTALSYDNQGTTFLAAKSSTVSFSSTCTATWTVTLSNNTFVDANNQTTGWLLLNNANGTDACTEGFVGSTSANGSGGSGSFTLTVCPNPIPGMTSQAITGAPVTSLKSYAGAATIQYASGNKTIPVKSWMTQQRFSDVPPSSYYFDSMNIVAKRTVYIPPSSGTSNNCQATGQNPCPGCPNSSITRDEAAQWIIRAIFGNSISPDFATRLYNSSGYVTLTISEQPNTGGNYPTINSGSGMNSTAVYIAK